MNQFISETSVHIRLAAGKNAKLVWLFNYIPVRAPSLRREWRTEKITAALPGTDRTAKAVDYLVNIRRKYGSCHVNGHSLCGAALAKGFLVLPAVPWVVY